MVLCSVPECKNRSDHQNWKRRDNSDTNDAKITFHSFPKNATTRSLWLDILGINSPSISSNSRICSRHFEAKFLDRSSPSLVRLRPNALPCKELAVEPATEANVLDATMKLQNESSDRDKNSGIEALHEVHRLHTVQASSSFTDTSIHSYLIVKYLIFSPRATFGWDYPSVQPSTSKMDKATIVSSEDFFEISKECQPSVKPSISKADKGTMTTLEQVYESPEKRRLRRRIEFVKEESRKKIRNLQQNLRRHTDEIATLKSVLKTLRENLLLNEEQADMLHMLGGSNDKIFRRLIQRRSNKSVPRQYEPELRSFALTLHYYSPRAYEYVRSQFDSCLPHAKTISSWYKSVDGAPGISTEALNSITERVKNTDYKLIASLQFDEMAIREHLEYDGSKFSGYTDMGDDIACDNVTLASQVLVFLIVCINGGWKVPIAYYFIKGIDAQQKSNLITQCITAVHETGLTVVSVTCDGSPTNFSAFKKLGCNLDDPYLLQTSFPHPVTSEKVVAFLDPSHMMKLIRNVLAEIQKLIDAYNQQILWLYIIKLHQLQEQEGMHLGNKLRSSHVNFWQQKMKVRLATQVFSQSVADALLFCKNCLMLDGFESCEATSEFLLRFNDLFDILNSKNPKQSGLKRAMNSENVELIRNKFNEIKLYILSLKNTSGERIINTRRKTGFLGFLICIESALTLYEELCEKKHVLNYIPFYKLSQDHIELLFGCIRQHGGGNNNPTVRQFKASMKKILVHADVRSSATGNCIPLEEISILHVSSAKKIINSQFILNSTSRLSRLEDSVTEDNFDETRDLMSLATDHNYNLFDVREKTEFSTNVTEYIAGYVVMQLKKRLYCEICVEALTENIHCRTNLISIKNRGGLVQPSNDVRKICQDCEMQIRCIIHASDLFVNPKFTEPFLTNQVLKHLIGKNLFQNLTDHTHDQSSPMENHAVHLIRAIVQKYIKIRLHYIALSTLDKSKSKRQLYNKLVLFKGQ